MSDLDPKALRNAFGSFLTGVTVVTARTAKGEPVGFTANSFSSVSLDPPLLLVCPSKHLSSFAVFNTCSRFAISILAEGQQSVSNIFAASKEDRFSLVPWQDDAHDCPLIEGAAAHFSCATHDRMEAGDHLILIGRIDDFQTSGDIGLGYGNGGYFSLGLERQAAQRGRTSIAGAIIDYNGHVLLEPVGPQYRLPQIEVPGRSGALDALSGHFKDQGLAVDWGPVYSIFDDTGSGETFTYYRGTVESDTTGTLGQFHPTDRLSGIPLVNSAQATMLRRYALESRNRIFSLYVGDETLGNVHMFGEGPVA